MAHFLQALLDKQRAEIDAAVDNKIARVIAELGGAHVLDSSNTSIHVTKRGRASLSEDPFFAAVRDLGKTPERKPGQKRTPIEIERLTERLCDLIQRHGNERIEQIADRMNMNTRDLNLPLKRLIAAKRIVAKGQKRATRYTARAVK